MISRKNTPAKLHLIFKGLKNFLKFEVKVEHEFEYLAEIYRLGLQYWRRH